VPLPSPIAHVMARAVVACASHERRRMTATVLVASLVELPPGKGKVVEVAGRRITVFNREGRFYASSTPAARHAPIFDTSATCPAHGRTFDVYMQDSPADRHDEPECHIRVDDDGIWLILG
jgi:nitrite reductase/ring-hydroxylating ferredoxin subunit